MAGEGEATGAAPETTATSCINGEGEATGARPELIIMGESEATGARPENSSQCTVIHSCDNQYVIACNN